MANLSHELELQRGRVARIAADLGDVREKVGSIPEPTRVWLRAVMETIAEHGHELPTADEGAGERARVHAANVVTWLDLLEDV